MALQRYRRTILAVQELRDFDPTMIVYDDHGVIAVSHAGSRYRPYQIDVQQSSSCRTPDKGSNIQSA